jgi:hypothetical protein
MSSPVSVGSARERARVFVRACESPISISYPATAHLRFAAAVANAVQFRVELITSELIYCWVVQSTALRPIRY